MSKNAFINKSEQPTNAELASALGPAKATWDQLLIELSREFGVNVHRWKCYSPQSGWALHAKRKERTIVWLAPQAGGFGVLFIFGAKAMQAARHCRLPQRVVQAITEAPKYPEGTGVRLAVRSSRDIGALKKLAAIKLAN